MNNFYVGIYNFLYNNEMALMVTKKNKENIDISIKIIV